MKRKQSIKTWSTPATTEQSRLIPCTLCGGSNFAPALACECFAYVRCRRCGLVQMNPQPEAASVASRYQENHGKDYLAYELANEKSFLNLQLLALRDIGFDKLEKRIINHGVHGGTRSFLDVGCATGALLEHLQQRGWQTSGVEIAPSAEYARKERGLDVRSLPLEENHFPNESFDLIHASHLIEHLNDPGSFIRETFRLLKPGAHLLLTTPNIGGFQSRLYKSGWRSAIFDHLYLFSRRTLSALLRKAGYKIELVRTWGGLASGAAPGWLKKIADRVVKPLGQGDVMIICARK